MINFEEIKQILEMMREHELSEFELEREGLRIRLKKETLAAMPAPGAGGGSGAEVAAPALAGHGSEPATPAPDELELAIVKSPIVGTFYRCPEPGAPSFVDVGSTVRRGQVLCIIEAMKLMNEIDSEFDGQIVGVFVENGQAVQYGERLFAIKTVS